MNREDIREALKWSLTAAVIVALWCGVLAVRKSRAAAPFDAPAYGTRQEGLKERGVRQGTVQPVWVIVVFEVRRKKIIGITEFVFTTYQDCRENAEMAKRRLGLHLTPVCFLRWIKGEPDSAL